MFFGALANTDQLKTRTKLSLMLKQSLQYLDVNLKMYIPETVLIYDGIKDVLNDKSQSNTENLLISIK